MVYKRDYRSIANILYGYIDEKLRLRLSVIPLGLTQ